MGASVKRPGLAIVRATDPGFVGGIHLDFYREAGDPFPFTYGRAWSLRGMYEQVERAEADLPAARVVVAWALVNRTHAGARRLASIVIGTWTREDGGELVRAELSEDD